jgi:ATP-binding cassette, subfamily B, bacterial MsbA
VIEILDSTPLEPEEPDAEDVSLGRARITFNNVEFAYKPSEPVLRGISFVAEAGQMTRLSDIRAAGNRRWYRSYCGSTIRRRERSKSTASISARFRAARLRENIAYVGQDIFLFNGTIRENIRFGSWGDV